MKRLNILSPIVLFIALTLHCFALSVKPPLFEDLVKRADAVVRAEVISKRCTWKGEGANRRIVTLVKLRVERCLVGDAAPEFELEQLGGVVGEDSLLVPGLPVFKVGDRDILFVRRNGQSFCPLVAATYGRYLIVQAEERGTEALVARNDGTPLRSVAEVSVPMGEARQGISMNVVEGTSMTLRVFEDEIIRCSKPLKMPADVSAK